MGYIVKFEQGDYLAERPQSYIPTLLGGQMTYTERTQFLARATQFATVELAESARKPQFCHGRKVTSYKIFKVEQEHNATAALTYVLASSDHTFISAIARKGLFFETNITYSRTYDLNTALGFDSKEKADKFVTDNDLWEDCRVIGLNISFVKEVDTTKPELEKQCPLY